MDADRMVNLLRRLAASSSRRGALRFLTASAISMAFARPLGFDTEVSQARRQRPNRPAHSGHHDRVQTDRKKKKKKKKTVSPPVSPPASSPPPPPPPPSPLPTRQLVTRQFFNFGQFTIPGSGAPLGIANPYPSTIIVNGFVNGTIADVNVFIFNYNHSEPWDVDVMLTASQIPAVTASIMSDVGASDEVVDESLVLDDQASSNLPVFAAIVTGTFRPVNFGDPPDPFPAPAPIPSGSSALSVFNGGNPNGTWQLFVVDDEAACPCGNTGHIDSGWGIEITAEVDV